MIKNLAELYDNGIVVFEKMRGVSLYSSISDIDELTIEDLVNGDYEVWEEDFVEYTQDILIQLNYKNHRKDYTKEDLKALCQKSIKEIQEDILKG